MLGHYDVVPMHHQNDKYLKLKKISSDCAMKSKETKIRFWDERKFWHEII